MPVSPVQIQDHRALALTPSAFATSVPRSEALFSISLVLSPQMPLASQQTAAPRGLPPTCRCLASCLYCPTCKLFWCSPHLPQGCSLWLLTPHPAWSLPPSTQSPLSPCSGSQSQRPYPQHSSHPWHRAPLDPPSPAQPHPIPRALVL